MTAKQMEINCERIWRKSPRRRLDIYAACQARGGCATAKVPQLRILKASLAGTTHLRSSMPFHVLPHPVEAFSHDRSSSELLETNSALDFLNRLLEQSRSLRYILATME